MADSPEIALEPHRHRLQQAFCGFSLVAIAHPTIQPELSYSDLHPFIYSELTDLGQENSYKYDLLYELPASVQQKTAVRYST